MLTSTLAHLLRSHFFLCLGLFISHSASSESFFHSIPRLLPFFFPGALTIHRHVKRSRFVFLNKVGKEASNLLSLSLSLLSIFMMDLILPHHPLSLPFPPAHHSITGSTCFFPPPPPWWQSENEALHFLAKSWTCRRRAAKNRPIFLIFLSVFFW